MATQQRVIVQNMSTCTKEITENALWTYAGLVTLGAPIYIIHFSRAWSELFAWLSYYVMRWSDAFHALINCSIHDCHSKCQVAKHWGHTLCQQLFEGITKFLMGSKLPNVWIDKSECVYIHTIKTIIKTDQLMTCSSIIGFLKKKRKF